MYDEAPISKSQELECKYCRAEDSYFIEIYKIRRIVVIRQVCECPDSHVAATGSRNQDWAGRATEIQFTRCQQSRGLISSTLRGSDNRRPDCHLFS